MVSADTLIVYTTNSTDGFIYRYATNQTFTVIRNSAGNAVDTTGVDMSASVRSDLATNTFNRLYRSPLIYNASGVTDTATLNSALIGLYRFSGYTDLGDTGLNIVKFNIDGTISADDYDNFETTRYSTDQNASTITTAKYYTWPLNSLGLSNISKTGNTGFGSRFGFDIDNTSPTWISGGSKYSGAAWRSADYVLYPPFLQIEYTEADTTPPQSITGLTNTSVSCSALNFNWTNPSDADYGNLMVWRNNTALTNLSNTTTGVAWTGLPGSTDITFSSKTCDLTGNCNATFVNMTRTTEACGVAPVAAFSADDTTVCTVDWIQFTDSSSNIPTSWNWSFGDGNVTTTQNPVKNYNITGTYTVNLTVANAYGSDSEVKTNYITVSACAIPTPAQTPTPVTEDWEACFPWCGIQELFFWNASSDVSGYKILDHVPEKSVQHEVNVTISAATGSLQLGAWVSPDGTPGVTTIAPGMWRFRTYHNVSSQVGTTTLEFHIVNRSSTGVETDLFYGNAITRDINTLDPTEQLLSYARRNVTTMFSGDRLVIKVNASTTSVTARTVYMWLGGNTNTSMVQASNFICCEGGGCNTGSEGIAILFGVVGGILGAIAILRRMGEAP